MTPSARKEAIRRAEDAALKAASERRWDDAYSFLEIRRGLLKMDQDHLSAADSSAASGSVIPARPTIPAEDARDYRDAARRLWMLLDDIDTLDDACRSDDAAFRKCARETQRKRFAILSGEHFDALSGSQSATQEPQ